MCDPHRGGSGRSDDDNEPLYGITRTRNIRAVQFGPYEMETWYGNGAYFRDGSLNNSALGYEESLVRLHAGKAVKAGNSIASKKRKIHGASKVSSTPPRGGRRSVGDHSHTRLTHNVSLTSKSRSPAVAVSETCEKMSQAVVLSMDGSTDTSQECPAGFGADITGRSSPQIVAHNAVHTYDCVDIDATQDSSIKLEAELSQTPHMNSRMDAHDASMDLSGPVRGAVVNLNADALIKAALLAGPNIVRDAVSNIPGESQWTATNLAPTANNCDGDIRGLDCTIDSNGSIANSKDVAISMDVDINDTQVPAVISRKIEQVLIPVPGDSHLNHSINVVRPPSASKIQPTEQKSASYTERVKNEFVGIPYFPGQTASLINTTTTLRNSCSKALKNDKAAVDRTAAKQSSITPDGNASPEPEKIIPSLSATDPNNTDMFNAYIVDPKENGLLQPSKNSLDGNISTSEISSTGDAEEDHFCGAGGSGESEVSSISRNANVSKHNDKPSDADRTYCASTVLGGSHRNTPIACPETPPTSRHHHLIIHANEDDTGGAYRPGPENIIKSSSPSPLSSDVKSIPHGPQDMIETKNLSDTCGAVDRGSGLSSADIADNMAIASEDVSFHSAVDPHSHSDRVYLGPNNPSNFFSEKAFMDSKKTHPISDSLGNPNVLKAHPKNSERAADIMMRKPIPATHSAIHSKSHHNPSPGLKPDETRKDMDDKNTNDSSSSNDTKTITSSQVAHPGEAKFRLDKLFVCPFCFKYTAKSLEMDAHARACTRNTPRPLVGDLVYYDHAHEIIIRRVCGYKYTLFCQNLALMGKLFLDDKLVYYSVESYDFFVVYGKGVSSACLIPMGFFSKEIAPYERNTNLACICVFPPFQRRRLGTLLIEFLYALAKVTPRQYLSGPELPLLPYGKATYCRYWCDRISKYVMEQDVNVQKLSTRQIANATRFRVEDILLAFEHMGASVKTNAGMVLRVAVMRKWFSDHQIGTQKSVLDSEGLAI